MDGAEEVAKQIEAIIGEQPERAARLFEVFIAACHEKAEELDDSGGSFGLLIDDLFHGWIKARQAAGADPDETADSLLSWMEDDPYGFCYDLDREAAKVLDKRGLEAFARRIRSKFESALAKLGRAADALESAWSEFLEEGLSHFTTGPLARKLHRSHPDVAARVYRALSLRIINAGKSKYYDAALGNLKLVKKCYAKGGLDTDWEALVAKVRERHARKRGFMAGFEEIVAGKTKKAAPSFLERARARSRFRKSP
jgi:hypothetical protein